MDDVVLLDLLSKHPELRRRIEGILGVAADLNGSIELADTAEERLIEEGRHLNREALQAWASNKVSQSAIRFENKHKNTRKDIKKTLLAQHIRNHSSRRTSLSYGERRCSFSPLQ